MNKSLQFKVGAQPKPRRISPGNLYGGLLAGTAAAAAAVAAGFGSSSGAAAAAATPTPSASAASVASGSTAATSTPTPTASHAVSSREGLTEALRDLEAASKSGSGVSRAPRKPRKISGDDDGNVDSKQTASASVAAKVKVTKQAKLPAAAAAAVAATKTRRDEGGSTNVLASFGAGPTPMDTTGDDETPESLEMRSAAEAASAAVLKSKTKAARRRKKTVSDPVSSETADGAPAVPSTAAETTDPAAAKVAKPKKPRGTGKPKSQDATLAASGDTAKPPRAKAPRKPRAPKQTPVDAATATATTGDSDDKSATKAPETPDDTIKKPRARKPKAAEGTEAAATAPPKEKKPRARKAPALTPEAKAEAKAAAKAAAKVARAAKAKIKAAAKAAEKAAAGQTETKATKPKAAKSKTKTTTAAAAAGGAESARADAEGLDFAFASMIAQVERVRPEPLPVLRGPDAKHIRLHTALRVIDDDLYFALASELLKVFGLEHRLRRKTQAQLASGQRRVLPSFPATMPASATKAQIEAAIQQAVAARFEPIEEHPFFFSEKVDGVRALLLFTSLLYFERPMQVVIDRKWDMWLVQLPVPSFLHDGTLLDVELLIDDAKVPGATAALESKSPVMTVPPTPPTSMDASSREKEAATAAAAAAAVPTTASTPLSSAVKSEEAAKSDLPGPVMGYKMVILDIVMVYGTDVHEHTHHSRQRIISRLLPCFSLDQTASGGAAYKDATPITFVQKSWLSLTAENLVRVLCRMYSSIREHISSQLDQRLRTWMASNDNDLDGTMQQVSAGLKARLNASASGGSDGLMLALNHWPLLPGTDREGLLKIKLSSQSTSDLIPLFDASTGLLAICSQEDGVTPLVLARQTIEDTMAHADRSKIPTVEAMLSQNVAMTNNAAGLWCPKDIRWDKAGLPPNHISVVEATVKQMKENITYEYLLERLEACEAAASGA